MISVVGKILPAMRRKACSALQYIASKALLLVGDLGFGEVSVGDDQIYEVAALLCANQGSSKACEVQHLIFSAPPDVPKTEAFRTLRMVAMDWVDTYASGRSWALAEQDHNGKAHLHLLVQNVGDDGRALKIRPYQVKELAAMAFTLHAVTAKGVGKARSTDVYPKAEKLTVRTVARDLAHVFNPSEGLEALVSRHPDFSDFRRRKDGNPISFKYGKRRIRISTLQQFMSDILGDVALLATSLPVPALPLMVPPSTVSLTATLGLGSTGLNELAAEINQFQPRPPRPTQPKIKPLQLPPP